MSVLAARLAVLATATAVSLAAPSAAHAQRADDGSLSTRRHVVSLGFGGGASVPTGRARDALKTGVNGQGFVLLQLPGGFPALRFNAGYQKFDFKNSIAGGADANQQILSGVGGLSFNLLSGPVRPYVTAGLGAFNVKTEVDGSAGSASESKTNFGIDGGAGISLSLGRVSGFVEGRVQNVYTKNGGTIDTKSIRAVPVTFGLLIGL